MRHCWFRHDGSERLELLLHKLRLLLGLESAKEAAEPVGSERNYY